MQKAALQHSPEANRPEGRQNKGAAVDSPQGGRIAQLAAMAGASPAMTAQRKLAGQIDNSPRMAIQCKAVERILDSPRAAAQRAQTSQLAKESGKPNHTGLPDNLKNGVESLSGMSMDNVKVHYNSSQPAQLGALAYAQGSDIHVAPGQEKHLPHEAWHVVQQAQGRVKPTMQMKGCVPVNDDESLEREADVMGGRAAMLHPSDGAEVAPPTARQLGGAPLDNQTFQMAFNGPQFNQAGNHNGDFPGEGFVHGATKANTGCGTSNCITTAGATVKPGAKSKPGTPTKMNLYRGGFSRGGGLVRDKNISQASTKMHLINHRLRDNSDTQNNPANIFLGSQKTNNPTHLHQVETPVIDALDHATRRNLAYETAMNNAQPLQDINGNNVLFWPDGNVPPATAVPAADLTEAYINNNGQVAEKPILHGGAKKRKYTHPGKALAYNLGIGNYNYAASPHHLWLTYRVTANYAGVPAHVMPGANSNADLETIFAGTKRAKQQAMLLNKIADFTNDFAPNAFPATFTNSVTYYYATYDPNNRYASETENLSINADL